MSCAGMPPGEKKGTIGSRVAGSQWLQITMPNKRCCADASSTLRCDAVGQTTMRWLLNRSTVPFIKSGLRA